MGGCLGTRDYDLIMFIMDKLGTVTSSNTYMVDALLIYQR